MATQPTTLRLPEETKVELDAVARTEGKSISEIARVAIDAHIAARRKDKAFQERLRKRIDEDREVLERLAK